MRGAVSQEVTETTGASASPAEVLWRFELDTTVSLPPGTIRVIAGEVALATESAIVFRLTGRRGERVVFSFQTDR